MSLLLFLVVSGVMLACAYRGYGALLTGVLGIRDDHPTPALAQRDGRDFEPARASVLLPQHFSAIAAAGPIVGPILAATYFGWLPAWLWILLGSVFIGGVHDLTTLLASVRHKARSVAELVRRYMNRRSYSLFLVFVWVSLIYVIAAFTDVTSAAFVQQAALLGDEAGAPGPAVATSSLLYLGLAVLMGLALRYAGLNVWAAKAIFLPLVFLSVAAGPLFPLDLQETLGMARPQLAWNYLLLAYCFVASLTPVWLLLQPRGTLGGYFLYIVMAGGVLGVLAGACTGTLAIELPAFRAGAPLFHFADGIPPLFPVLFITIACGACSGFHGIVASGTTSKQLARESDAPPVAYGSMLLEAFFACLSLATVMILSTASGSPDAIFSNGIARFIHEASFHLIPISLAFSFALLCFATFIFDTLDACTRLARHVVVELTGWNTAAGRALATGVSVAVPAVFLSLPPLVVDGKTIALWKVFWSLFGTSNQLLAALALLGVTMWLHRTGRAVWPTLLPTLFMAGISLWSLGLFLEQNLGLVRAGQAGALLVSQTAIAFGLVVLSVWLLVEAALIFVRPEPSRLPAEPAA